jgi:peptidylprolyl isomerase
MKNFTILTIFCLGLVSADLFCANENQTETTINTANSDPKKEIAKISEAFGHLIGKNIESMGVQFDIQYVIKGLNDAAAGKTSPMTEMECIQAITAAQEYAFKEQSEGNLKKAEEFLKKNASLGAIISLAEGKVQYKIEKEGKGDVLQTSHAPLIRYVGKFLDGTVFGASKEDEPISLDEIIPGLKTGLEGMKEGEKRTIYIHPDLGYGTRGALPPNSLLTFEIELVKANAPVQQEKEEELVPTGKKAGGEIAFPEQMAEHVR